MKDYQSTFQRIEKKYLLDEKQYMALRQGMEPWMQADSFAKSTVCNIYFDTPDSRLIRTSLEKPVYKEKLRLRSYGTPEAQSAAFVELKKKYKGIVFKRRIDMNYHEAEEYLYKGIEPEVKGESEKQILREIDWFLEYYEAIQPAMYLSYDRSALCGKEDKGLRITFDTHILYRTQALDLAAGVWGSELLRPGQRLMEIKALGAMPLWLSSQLSELQIYPASFSKYGKAFQQTQAALASGAETIHATQEQREERGGRICA